MNTGLDSEENLRLHDPLDLIEEGCFLCLRFGLEPAARPVACLEVKDGMYALRRQNTRMYNPLEAVLIGEEVGSGDWKVDAAHKLGVSSDWIAGFLDGFAQAGERLNDQDYLQGFLTAEELLARRFKRFLK